MNVDNANFWPFKGTKWAQPSITHTRLLMRHVFENREEAKSMGRAARREVEEVYSIEATSRVLHRLVTDVQRRAQSKMHKDGPSSQNLN